MLLSDLTFNWLPHSSSRCDSSSCPGWHCALPISRTLLFLTALATVSTSLLMGGDTKVGAVKPVYRVGVNSVFMNVSVTDRRDRSIGGLPREAFTVYDEKVKQDITLFKAEQAPVSVGIIFDRSASMAASGNITGANAAIREFLKSAQPQDEFFLISFNQMPRVTCDFTHDAMRITNQVELDHPAGRTALYDAVYLGLEKIQNATNEKKALLLITDGEDNSSRYSAADVRELAKESNVEFYVIGERGQLDFGRIQLENIAEITGGRAFFPDSFDDFAQYSSMIQEELRSQYLLGYMPSNFGNDGTWHKVQVRLDHLAGFPKLCVRARKGYFSAR